MKSTASSIAENPFSSTTLTLPALLAARAADDVTAAALANRDKRLFSDRRITLGCRADA